MMNSSFGGGYSQGNGDKSEAKSEGTLPIFIKQIHSQEADTIKMFGFEYKMITLVAIVRNINHSSTKISYTLDDFSGRIDAHSWLEEGDDSDVSRIMLNTYVRVVGAVRSQGEEKSLLVYKIDTVGDINQVNTHYLEVLNARYMTESFSKEDQLAGQEEMNYDDNKFNDNDNNGPGGLKGKELIIFQAIKTFNYGDTGISRQELLKKFPQISPSELTAITDKMAQDGHIYTSIDTDHFLAV